MSCRCETCRRACEVTPGWFHPDQIAPLAANLGLTEQELFDQHLSVGYMDKNGGARTHYLEPSSAHHKPGSVHARAGGGKCHWFRNGKCQIHDIEKPAECAFSSHDRTPAEFRSFAVDLLRAWEGRQALVEQLARLPSRAASPLSAY